MPLTRCVYCGLPTRIHFAWCQESGAKGNMPPEALRPGAIVVEARELRFCKPAAARARAGAEGAGQGVARSRASANSPRAHPPLHCAR